MKGSPGQCLLYENKGHSKVIGCLNVDWVGSPSNRHSTSGYHVLVGDNLISWKNNKLEVVARSSAETQYRGMAFI